MRIGSLPDGRITNVDRGVWLTMPFDLSFTVNELSSDISINHTVNNTSFSLSKSLSSQISLNTILNRHATTGELTVLVTLCNGTTPISGVIITVYQGLTIVGSGTTDSSGSVNITGLPNNTLLYINYNKSGWEGSYNGTPFTLVTSGYLRAKMDISNFPDACSSSTPEEIFTNVNNDDFDLTKNLYDTMSLETILSSSLGIVYQLNSNISTDVSMAGALRLGKNLLSDISNNHITNFNMSPSNYALSCGISTDSILNGSLSMAKKLFSSISSDTSLNVLMSWDLLNGNVSGVLNYIDSNLEDGPHLITVIDPVNVYFRDKYPMPDLTQLNNRLASRFTNPRYYRR